MVGVRGGDINPVPIASAVGRMKRVDPALYELAQVFY